MIRIDGSYLEGGGQILRTATTLSVFLGIPCHLYNIRRKRKNPGLKDQHLAGLFALRDLSQGRIEGGFIGSQEIKFYPGKGFRKRIKVKIKTAGSVTLILQSLMIPAASLNFPIKISFEGGATETHFSPTLNYIKEVVLPILKKMGYKMEIEVFKRGYFPQGGAKVEVTVFPWKEKKPLFLLKRGKLKKIKIFSYASFSLRLKRVAERQALEGERLLEKYKKFLKKEIEYFKTRGAGSSFDLIAVFQKTRKGSNALGMIGRSSEKVAQKAVDFFKKEISSSACLDSFMGDQILPYLALVPKESQVSVTRLTRHAQTNIWVIEKFLKGKFRILGNLIKWVPS